MSGACAGVDLENLWIIRRRGPRGLSRWRGRSPAIGLPHAPAPCQCGRMRGIFPAAAFIKFCRCCLAAGAIVSFACVGSAFAQILVDLELVLAVDVSLSMDLDEQRLQREGYIAAFRDGEVHKAITSGPYGRIAVAYMEWAGPSVQNVVVPWTVIDGATAALAMADKLDAQPISRAS